MHRHPLALRKALLPLPGAPPIRPVRPRSRIAIPPAFFASTTSSPPEAEKASADSGGSRSKGGPVGAMPDSLAERSARGRTGGGKPLESSSNAPAKPKIHNAKVPGQSEGLTEEQKREVEEHNRDFEKKHDRAGPAAEDKVDKKFWQGGGRTERN